MMFRLFLGLGAALAVAGAAIAGAPAAPAAPPAPSAGPLPAHAYFDEAALGTAALSPTGRYLAVVRRNGEAHDVVVYDQQTHESRSVYGLKSGDFRFDWLKWKDDDRVLVGVSRGYLGNIGGLALALNYGRFIISVDRASQHPVVMFRDDAEAAKHTGVEAALLDVLKGDPDHILAVAPSPGGVLSVWKADLRTGSAVIVEKGDGSTFAFDVDANSNVIARYRAVGRSIVVEGRGPGETGWSQIVKLRKADFKEAADFELLAPATKPGQLYVLTAPKTAAEGETRSLRIYDFGSKTLSAPIWPALKYEPKAIVTKPASGELMGVCYVVDVLMCDFKDKELTASYRGLVKFFDTKANVHTVDMSQDGRWLLLVVDGPTEPGAYYVYDIKNKHVEALGSQAPQLPEAKLARAETFAYQARDGVTVPAYLTRPLGGPKGPAPLVVMPHGGPEVRDQLSFDIYAQYFASRGYLVFQPNYRGSAGYGLSYAEAGHHQWGLKMQDDVTDGVKALIASGQADPARICIVGASYGGYAALIGGAETPELYKCVVSVAGVSDLVAFMKWERKESGDAEDPRYQHWLKLVGDPKTDADRLAKTSPVNFAAAYSLPVLMFHGDADDTVPVEQSKKMEAALRKAGKPVKLTVYKGEGHSQWSREHEEAALIEIGEFLDKHIGPASGAGGAR